MGAAEQRNKSAAQAAYMKERGITRTTAACVWHCGAMVRVGGEALLNHLNQCRGGGARRLSRFRAR